MLTKQHVVELKHQVDPDALLKELSAVLAGEKLLLARTGPRAVSAENQRVILSGKEHGVYATGTIHIVVETDVVRATYDLMGLRVLYPVMGFMMLVGVGVAFWSGQYIHLWILGFALLLPFQHRRAHKAVHLLVANTITRVSLDSGTATPG